MSARLSIRTLRWVPSINPCTPSTISNTSRTFTATARAQKWTGSEPSDHQTNEKDSHNVQQDAVNKGKQDRQKPNDGTGSVAAKGQASEHGETQKSAAKEFPNKPKGPVIGLQDERGGVSPLFSFFTSLFPLLFLFLFSFLS
ncbi:hypothetical protein PVAG01_00637 [Phlyctema vagabunda]|uniref:Uncharacterized protein n=1 Tax=Phlyctema vagabunda TaxID=108571 RepID=A0ABR4PUS4_9HELO